MPEDGVELQPEEKLLSTDEIVRLATTFVREGVTKIRLTGGEPTVRRDILDLVARLGQLRRYGLKELAMTSNGIALKRKLPNLVKAGLTHLNLSLDTLDPWRYQLMSRRKGLEVVLETIDLAIKLGVQPLKINCVVIKGLNDSEINDFVEFTRTRPVEVRFIEYMPFDGNRWNKDKMLSYKDMLARIETAFPTFSKVVDHKNDTSKGWRVPGFVGKVGFITSMTNHFCGSCNRLRVTSDGNLKVCLFGNTEVSLRDMMRASADDGELLKVIGAAVKRKKKQHAGITELETMKNRPMILIGEQRYTPYRTMRRQLTILQVVELLCERIEGRGWGTVLILLRLAFWHVGIFPQRRQVDAEDLEMTSIDRSDNRRVFRRAPTTMFATLDHSRASDQTSAGFTTVAAQLSTQRGFIATKRSAMGWLAAPTSHARRRPPSWPAKGIRNVQPRARQARSVVDSPCPDIRFLSQIASNLVVLLVVGS